MIQFKISLFLALFLYFNCSTKGEEKAKLSSKDNFMSEINDVVQKNNYQKALVAGGCFWCVESTFEKHEGIIYAISGYAGGEIENPSYELVSSGKTKHIESVLIIFDPKFISYKKVLEVLWKEIDPTDSGGQFVDRGFQYTTAIFYFDENQKKVAEKSKSELQEKGIFQEKIITPILPYKNFYQAEDYHQDYYQKNPIRYNYYRRGSGRDRFLESVWKK